MTKSTTSTILRVEVNGGSEPWRQRAATMVAGLTERIWDFKQLQATGESCFSCSHQHRIEKLAVL